MPRQSGVTKTNQMESYPTNINITVNVTDQSLASFIKRGIIFADGTEHFAEAAHDKAAELQMQMQAELERRL